MRRPLLRFAYDSMGCRSLSNWPQTRINLLAPQALLARLDRRLHLHRWGTRSSRTQQTLRHTIAWSYDLLNVPEQQLFQRLSVFVDGCELAAADAVCAPLPEQRECVLEGVASLLDKSLLYQREQPGQEPRLSMLETIKSTDSNAWQRAGRR